MKTTKSKLSAIATGVAFGVAQMASQAAEPPAISLAGAKTTAEIRAGATLNDQASFQAEIPASVPFDIVAKIKPAAADVGTSGSLVVVLEVEGLGQFNLLSGGIWVPFDAANVQAYKTKTLTAEEEISVLDNFIGTDTNLTGTSLKAYVGYFTGGDVNTITYTASPASVAIAAVPAAGCPAGTTASSGTAMTRTRRS